MTTFTRQNPPAGFYTYAYLREDGRPYYIGKGKGTRAWDRHGAPGKYWRPPVADRILFLKWGLEQDQAFAHEIYLIALYGNALVGGWLTKNFDQGGLGATGSRHTDEHKAHMQELMSGRTFDEEAIEKMSAYAKNRSEQHRQKLAQALSIPREWHHEEHGYRKCSMTELSREFEGVERGNLAKVVAGKISHAYGWTCLTPERQYVAAKPAPKAVTWIHAELGTFFGTAKELAAAFPGLYNTALNRVLRGVSNHHGGWTVAA